MAAKRKRFAPQTQTSKLCYTKLADLSKKENKTVNIFGIVKFFKSPCKSKGRDYCLTLSLVDDSFQSTDESLVCNIFSPCEDQLPLVKCVGDIVRLAGVRISRFRGELQGKGTSTLSWVTFDGYSSDPITHTAASIHYTMDDRDRQILKELKTWAGSHQSIQPHFYKKTISQLHPDVIFFNLACQVVSVCQAVNSNCLILTVWDSTTPKCQSYCLEELLTNTLRVSESIKQEARGMTIEVFLYDEHSTGHSKNLQPGDFILLNNVHALPDTIMPKAGQPHIISFVIHKGRINGRGVQKLPQDSPFVRELEEQIESFKTNKQLSLVESASQSTDEQVAIDTRTLQTSCTVTNFPLVPFTTIEGIKKCPKVPNKFRCRAKALAFLPNNVRDFVQTCCLNCRTVSLPVGSIADSGCKKKLWNTLDSEIASESVDSRSESSQEEPLEKSHQEASPKPILEQKHCSTCNQKLSLVYVFSLLCEDTTGILNVMVFDEDVKEFLTDLPSAEAFVVCPEIQENIRASLIRITDNRTNDLVNTESQPFGNRPWMEICVISYYVQGQGVLYRMFGTSMV